MPHKGLYILFFRARKRRAEIFGALICIQKSVRILFVHLHLPKVGRVEADVHFLVHVEYRVVVVVPYLTSRPFDKHAVSLDFLYPCGTSHQQREVSRVGSSELNIPGPYSFVPYVDALHFLVVLFFAAVKLAVMPFDKDRENLPKLRVGD